MATAICQGPPIAWGVKEEYLTLPIVNLPAGALKVRRTMRARREVRARVKTADGIKDYFLLDEVVHLKLWGPVGANKREVL